eukprot:1795458-Prymnesium_polylepis.2
MNDHVTVPELSHHLEPEVSCHTPLTAAMRVGTCDAKSRDSGPCLDLLQEGEEFLLTNLEILTECAGGLIHMWWLQLLQPFLINREPHILVSFLRDGRR